MKPASKTQIAISPNCISIDPSSVLPFIEHFSFKSTDQTF